MEKNILKEEIVGMLEVLVEQCEVINGYKSRIPQIEIDIILSNIRELYSKFRLFDKCNKSPEVETESTNTKTVTPEVFKGSCVSNELIEGIPLVVKDDAIITETPVVAEETAVVAETPVVVEEIIKEEQIAPSVIEKKIVEKEIVAKTEIIPPVTIPNEEIKVEMPVPVKEEKKQEISEQSENKTKSKKFSLDLFTAHNTVADKFKDEKKSLNEKHTANYNDKSLASKLQKNPLKDMMAAIGINEKFKFINELFDGSLQKYNDCLSQLNGFAGGEAALTYFSFLKEEFGWDESTEAYIELHELVTRRYPS